MGESAAEVAAEIELDYRERLAAAIRDRDAGWAAADALAEQMNRPLYERTCVCGDFESQHQGGGPCGVCCQSDRGGDGCEAFVPFSYERLTDVQKGLVAYTAARAKRTT